MSTKALKRELAAAIAMLLVAMIALSGSTYAWFASNNKVQAENMSVTAMSDAAFLEITTKGGVFTGNSMAATASDIGSKATDAALYPATPYFLDNTTSSGALDDSKLAASGSVDGITWHYTYSDNVDVSDKGDAQTWRTVGATSSHAIEESALINEFSFRMSVDGTTGHNLRASKATLTGGAEIDKAVQILLAGPNGYQVIKSDGTIDSFKLDGTEATTPVLATDVAYCEADAAGVVVKAYVYYEGSHEKVTTTDLKAILGNTVSLIEFVID